ncbi:universal stress protein [Baekduia sp.]|jgi:nucleotide-binding universal stress UspA family protein|uniref:universal stress protein n=1 Tax=Baekduia sp. TaxID=2600305 RepID=UPI002DFC4E2E|nr:universal stress protein [Baekduia sp.]
MTLVVGYDGTEGSRTAYARARELASRLGEDVLVVFSFESPRLGGELHDLDEAIRERGEAVVAEALAEAGDVAVTTQVRMQGPAEGLIAAAEEVDATMIVVGSYGERPLRSALVGATPTRLLHLSERPVLVVRASG